MDQEPFEFPPELFSQVPLFAEIAKAMSWTGGPVNWDIARQIASAMASSGHAPPVIDEDVEELRDAARLAEAWLVEATGIPQAPAMARIRAMTPQGWTDHAMDVYPELLEPLGGKIAGALAVEPGGDAPMAAVVRQMVPLFLGIQCGSVIGTMARTSLTAYDVSLPIEEEGLVPVLVQHVDAHAQQYSLDRRETRYWVAAEASAFRLLAEALPWTRTGFWSLYHAYLAAVDVNLAETVERLQSLDITNPEQMQSAVGESLFGIGGSGGAALEALRRYLALLRAAGARAVGAATDGKLVSHSAIEESMARRSAESGGALERFLGIDVPPDVLDGAHAFTGAALDAGGWDLLLRLWGDPDGMPSPGEFTRPGEWILRVR